MGILADLINLDESFQYQSEGVPTVIDYNQLGENKLFKKAVKKPKTEVEKLVLNKLSSTSVQDRDTINNAIYTRYDNSNVIESTPRCACGAIKGRFNLRIHCDVCRTIVRPVHDDELQAKVWIRAPEGIPALMNPMVLYMLSQRFKIGRFDLIRWLCDTSYVVPGNTPVILNAIQELGFERGFKNFYLQFDRLMEYLFNNNSLKKSKNREEDMELYKLIREDRDKVFCKMLPIPNRLMFVVEKTNFKTYIDPAVKGMIDALWLMVGIESPESRLTQAQRENRTVKALYLIMTHHIEVIATNFSKKRGAFRRHVFGTSAAWSFRTVISSNTAAHRRDEIYIPWGVGMTVFRYQLINKLRARGYAPLKIMQLLADHAINYSPLFDELFQELITATPNGEGFTCLANRNPSLQKGSIQQMRITRVKTNPKDITTTISILVVRPFNADFDGDAMNFTLMLDNFMKEGTKRLAPHFSAFNLSAPYTVSNDAAMPKQTVATIANWFYYADKEPVDPVKRELMLQHLV